MSYYYYNNNIVTAIVITLLSHLADRQTASLTNQITWIKHKFAGRGNYQKVTWLQNSDTVEVLEAQRSDAAVF